MSEEPTIGQTTDDERTVGQATTPGSATDDSGHVATAGQEPAEAQSSLWSSASERAEDVLPHGAAGLGSGAPVEAAPGGPTRSIDARLARLHLRGGAITLARAELETMAGQGTLDREALADLAEARWRNGDLVGGGEAARAHLDAGGMEPLAMVVATEALAAEGRLVESRQLAMRVAERAPGLVDRLFAGQARSHSWADIDPDQKERDSIPAWGLLSGGQDVIGPGRKLRRPRPHDQQRDAEGSPVGAPHIAPRAAGTLTGTDRSDGDTDRSSDSDTASRDRPRSASGATPAVREEARGAADPRRTGAEAVARPAAAEPRVAPPEATEPATQVDRVAGRELGSIEEAIDRDVTASVPVRLALLLRLDRAMAPLILSLAERALDKAAVRKPEAAALHLVRGDAYRLLGREVEADAAFQRSRLALDASATDEEPA